MEFKRKTDKHTVETYEAKNGWNMFWGFRTLKSEEQYSYRGSTVSHYVGGVRVKCEEKNKAGELHGRVMDTPLTGEIEKYTYDHNRKHGAYKGYCLVTENRLVDRAGQYKNDKKVGKWVECLNADKSLFSVSYYDAKSPLGFKINYDEKQQPQQFTALYGDYEIKLLKNGVSIRHPDISKDTAPLGVVRAMDIANSAYDVHSMAVSFMERTMANESEKADDQFEAGMQDVLFQEMKACGDMQEKLKQAQAGFSNEKTDLIEARAAGKQHVSAILGFMGKSQLILD